MGVHLAVGFQDTAPPKAGVENPGFDKSKICLSPVRVDVMHGFIFVNLDPDAKPMDDCFPGVRDEVVAFVPHIADLKPLEWVEIPENCN